MLAAGSTVAPGSCSRVACLCSTRASRLSSTRSNKSLGQNAPHHRMPRIARTRQHRPTDNDSTLLIDADYYVDPYKYDVFLPDLHHEELAGSISSMLGKAYLSKATEEEVCWPVTSGVMFGPYRRLFVNLVVGRVDTNDYRNIAFVIDTCSPSTYICPQALAAFGFKDVLPKQLKPGTLDVHGECMEVMVSPQDKHFKEINILGTDFFHLTGLRLEANYLHHSVCLVKQ